MSIRRCRRLAYSATAVIGGFAIHMFGWWVVAFLFAHGVVVMYIDELDRREELGKLSESWRRLMDPKCRCAQCVSSRRRS